METSIRYLTKEESKELANQGEFAGEIYLSRQKQEYIKSLMFKALEDPREQYKEITIDELTKNWKKVEDPQQN
jgi:hypothetical protein